MSDRSHGSPGRRILMVAANPATSPTTGWPVGFWWAELVHPWWTFHEAGYSIEIRSPDGGALAADAFSDPEHESGYAADDLLSLGFKRSERHAALLADTASIHDVDVDAFDALFLVGGQSPMVTFRGNEDVAGLVVRFFEAAKPTALVCHATCVLLDARLTSGDLLVRGRSWTGFANGEEEVADHAVGRRLQPFWIETEARALSDTNFIVDQPFRPFAVRDGWLITGQQQNSGSAAARLVIEALGR
ncbi:MAG: type 1 glutamine amidotransferase domain-containing protein [Gemmatimonadetes bacterium]|nr:type 1 glutamine amidotransferase domain-containing protein [Gemmatimonadota bacterium]